jgi:clan AA aspartic protease (TIGR02281 family)
MLRCGACARSTMTRKITVPFLFLLMLTGCYGSSAPAPLSAACGAKSPGKNPAAGAQPGGCVDDQRGWLIERFSSAQFQQEKQRGAATTVSLQQYRGGTFLVPVTINDRLTLRFMVDSGATDVTIPADVVLSLIRTGTLASEDFLGETTYTLADGSTRPSQAFRIRTLKVGDTMLENVIGGVAPEGAKPLLGQSFLSRFKSWSINNNEWLLVLEE